MYTLNAVKLRNSIHALAPDLKVELRNVRINGALQGCSGFVTDPDTGRVVYVSTDRNHGTVRDILVRVARHTKDYVGGPNTFTPYEADAAASGIVALIQSAAAYREYERHMMNG